MVITENIPWWEASYSLPAFIWQVSLWVVGWLSPCSAVQWLLGLVEKV